MHRHACIMTTLHACTTIAIHGFTRCACLSYSTHNYYDHNAWLHYDHALCIMTYKIQDPLLQRYGWGAFAPPQGSKAAGVAVGPPSLDPVHVNDGRVAIHPA